MFNRILPLLSLLALFLQGCAFSQVISEHTQRGTLVKEEGTGVVVERSRRKMIELVSPLSVRVYEEVERQETTKRYYQNVRIRSEATPKEFPYWDVWTKLLLSTTVIPLFTPDYWTEASYIGPNCRLLPEACIVQDVPKVLARDPLVEAGARSTIQRQQNVPQPDTVSLFINGFHKGDLRIGSDDVVAVDLHDYPDLADWHKPLKLTFKYHDAYAYSLLPLAEVERIFGQGGAAVPAGAP
jgi:hypothetical protein